GIYKRLGRSMGLVDDDLELDASGDRLVRVWERERGLPGFADRKGGTDGGRFARALGEGVRKSWLGGTAEFGRRSWSSSRLVSGRDSSYQHRSRRRSSGWSRLAWRWDLSRS